MTLKQLLRILRENLILVLVTTTLGLAGSLGYLVYTKPTYTATATAFVTVDISSDPKSSASVGSYVSASQLALQKTQAYVPLFSDRSTAEIIKDELKSPQAVSSIASSLKATTKTSTATIAVSAASSDPETAQKLADASVNATAKRVETLEGEKSPVRVKLLSSATLSSPVKSPKPSRTVVAGLLAGLFLGVAIAVLRQFVDTKIRSDEDIAPLSTKPVLAMLPESASIARTEEDADDDGTLEIIRKLRTGLRYSMVDREARVTLFTSSLPGEGKSSTALSLAKVMALAGNQVVLIDGDLRRPTVHRSFHIENAVGLSQLLAGAVDLNLAMHPSDTEGLFLIPAGDIVPNPSELLGSNRMKQLLSKLREDYIVIIDGPPLLPVTDSAVLAGIVDAVIMVIKAGSTTSEQVSRSIQTLRTAEDHLIGFVLNRVKGNVMSKHGYSTKYGYGYAPYEPSQPSNGKK